VCATTATVVAFISAPEHAKLSHWTRARALVTTVGYFTIFIFVSFDVPADVTVVRPETAAAAADVHARSLVQRRE
jgi:hypothetical protein